jgi:hypothetical protein
VLEFDTSASIKFEILFPTSYIINPDDPGEEPKPVQITEIQDYLSEMTAKYGGYTISNPYGHPPIAGGYQGEPLEQNFWAMLIVPSHLMQQAVEDIKNMVSYFQELYRQRELLAYYYPVNRYVPGRQPLS